MANENTNNPSTQEINDIMAKYDRESALRRLPRIMNLILSVVLIAFSALQLYSTWRIIPSTHMRPIHVAIVCFLAYALYPVKKGDFKSATARRIGLIIDVALSLLALFVFLYQVVNFEAIAMQTKYTPFQYVIGAIGIVLLLEACRRVAGLPIVCVAVAFMLVGLFGQHMPGFLNNRGFSVERIIKQLFYTQNGIFGTPIGASSTFIFLFILFGSFLEKTGVGDFFIDFGNAVAGKKRGGPAKVAVLVSALEGTVSGSSVANTVGSGSFTIPMMKRLGYPPEFAAATEAAASTGGQIMPPVMGAAAFLMLDCIGGGITYTDIIRAALIPALLYFVGIWFAVDFEARKHGLVGMRDEDIPKFKQLMIDRGYLVLPLVGIIATLSAGFTPSYAALIGIAIACAGSYLPLIGRLLAFAIHGRKTGYASVGEAVRTAPGLRPKDYLNALEGGARSILAVALACGVAGIIAGMITLTGVGTKLASNLAAFAGGHIFLILFFTMITSIILGMGVPTTANYLITSTMMAGVVASALNPGASTMTWQMLLPAHLFTFYFGIIADITPPVALAAMAGAAIAKSNPLKTGFQASKNAIAAFIVPYIFALNPAMLMIDASIPDVALIVISSLVGMYALSMAVVGHWQAKLNPLERLIVAAGGLCMVMPGLGTDLVGVILFAAVVLWQLRKKKALAA
ncbi:MAG: TRAP transporter permease [Clostridia bacterium]|nr:TRAP transporter permease [Clostridia bacterium]